MKARNAYALPAKSRCNAGAMTHKAPPRRREDDSEIEAGLLDYEDEKDEE